MSKKEQVNYDYLFEKSELEKKEEALARKKRLRAIVKRRRRRIIIGICFILFSIYLCSDYSNVRIVLANGNSIYTKQELMEIANIEYNKKVFFYPWFIVENKLEDEIFIDSASVSISWNGIMTITIAEKKVIGYYQVDDAYYLLIEGEESQLAQEDTSFTEIPFLFDLTEEQIEDYISACEEVDVQYLSLISEISHYESSYDDNMLMLTMQDGHTVYTTMEGFSLLNWYTTMIKGISSSNKCIMFIEETNTITTQECDSFNIEESASDDDKTSE